MGGVTEPRSLGSAFRNQSSAVAANRNQISALARRQRGLATWAQLRRRGVAKASIHRALAAGRLHEIHRGVYSTIPPSLMQLDAWHAAAILAGGPQACLCHLSAAWWAKLIIRPPSRIHVAVTSDRTSVDGLHWHRLALTADERDRYNRMPVTAPHRIPLDLAADLSLFELKGILAELEFHHGIGPHEVSLRRGYPGAAKLRRAVADHTPQLARTRSELERLFAAFLTDRAFALPEFNHPVGKSTVDALYPAQQLVIELDGVAGHTGERRVLRDHRRDMHRRADGLVPLRYHHAQLRDPGDRDLIEAELIRFGVPRL